MYPWVCFVASNALEVRKQLTFEHIVAIARLSHQTVGINIWSICNLLDFASQEQRLTRFQRGLQATLKHKLKVFVWALSLTAHLML